MLNKAILLIGMQGEEEKEETQLLQIDGLISSPRFTLFLFAILHLAPFINLPELFGKLDTVGK